MKKFVLPLIVLAPAISDYLLIEILELSGICRLIVSAIIAFIIYLLQELINKPYKFSFRNEDFVGSNDNGWAIKIPYKKHRKKSPSVTVYENNQEVIVGITIDETSNIEIGVGSKFDGYCIIK